MRVTYPVLVLSVILLVTSVSAALAFRDDFDTLDTSLWQVYANGGNISVSDGKLQVSAASTSSTMYPYAYLKVNPFPTSGDFDMRVRMQFNSIGSWGTGITVTTQAPTNGIHSFAADPNATWGYWADSGRTGYDTSWHDIEWIYSNGLVDYYVDGVRHSTYGSNGSLQYPPFATARPSAIWLGNPCVISPGAWSSFQIDYIEVVSLPEPCTIVPLTFAAGVLFSIGRKRLG